MMRIFSPLLPVNKYFYRIKMIHGVFKLSSTIINNINKINTWSWNLIVIDISKIVMNTDRTQWYTSVVYNVFPTLDKY